MSSISPVPRTSGSNRSSGPLPPTSSSNRSTAPLPPTSGSNQSTGSYPQIDTTSPDAHRASFQQTDYEATLPIIVSHFPNVGQVYITKIFRGTIHPSGLVWLDVDRQDASPPDFSDLAHLMYCFEVYGQIICILSDPQGGVREMELQRALADYRIRLLKLSKVATFESLREWHKGVLKAMFREGQDRAEGWRVERPELAGLLVRG